MLDYLSRFKSERDIVKRLFRNKLIDGYVEGLPNYNAAVDDAGRQSVKNKELDKIPSSAVSKECQLRKVWQLTV